MNRPDLVSTFTKINLWRLSQFRKIVYVDADVVALRAPDELFKLEEHFSASPDVGWPDCFNSGVMVLSPDMGDYYGLSALAQRGISFDGADQGLLNMHFKDWNRISFGYNVTPSGNYQYVPAFKHFQSTISMVHFIGAEKPWQKGREATEEGTGPYPEMIARWWAVYDRHYRLHQSFGSKPDEFGDVTDERLRGIETVQKHVKGETLPASLQRRIKESSDPETNATAAGTMSQQEVKDNQDEIGRGGSSPGRPRRNVPMSEWDATQAAPSKGSRPEASDLASHIYENTWNSRQDPGPFVAPHDYPEPPKDMYYPVPDRRESIKPIFPWETDASQPTRVFYEPYKTSSAAPPIQSPHPQDSSEPTGSSTTEDPSEPSGASSSTLRSPASPSELQSYARTNAWDDHPEIDRYLQRASQGRKAKLTVLHHDPTANEGENDEGDLGGSTNITRFPTEVERPSLPVTPAPRRGNTTNLNKNGDLPPAAGVPKQEDWDPVAKLEELQRRGSLLQVSSREPDSSEAVSIREPKNEDVAKPSVVSLTVPVKEAEGSPVVAAEPVAAPITNLAPTNAPVQTSIRPLTPRDDSTSRIGSSPSPEPTTAQPAITA